MLGTMMLLQQSNFSSIPSSLKQRNPLLHKQKFPFYFPTRPNASTFRISSLGDIAQIAHNKVLIAAGVSMAIGQISKPFTSVFLYGKEFDIKALVQPGGFPSSHSSATVSCATFLGLERGLSDPIFGLAVVYAGLVMYDAQGVRREVGIHAKTVNKLLLQMHLNHLHSKHKDALINSHPDSSNPPKLEAHEKSLLSQEATSLEPQQANASVLIKSGSKIKLSDEELLSSDLFSEDSKQISKLVSDGLLPLKETVGHTEVEVIAGALLGFLVGLAVYNFKMSGAQGAQPKESKTATTYESIEGGENRTRTNLLTKEDQGGIQVDKLQEKVHDPAGKGGPVFGAGKDENKQDLGVTGTG